MGHWGRQEQNPFPLHPSPSLQKDNLESQPGHHGSLGRAHGAGQQSTETSATGPGVQGPSPASELLLSNSLCHYTARTNDEISLLVLCSHDSEKSDGLMSWQIRPKGCHTVMVKVSTAQPGGSHAPMCRVPGQPSWHASTEPGELLGLDLAGGSHHHLHPAPASKLRAKPHTATTTPILATLVEPQATALQQKQYLLSHGPAHSAGTPSQ